MKLIELCRTPSICLLTLSSTAIHHAMTREQRLAALAAFSHKNTDLHSYEVDMGAVHALVLQLGYCVSSSCAQQEVGLVCQCLYQILSHCATRRKISLWQDLIMTELVPLLLQVGPRSWSVLAILCKLPVAKSSLVAYPRLPEQVANLLKSNDDSLVAEVLGALKDLSFRSKHTDNEVLWKAQSLPKVKRSSLRERNRK